MTSQTFDLIVIGTGSGGSVTAGKCAKAGLNVAQVDALPFGGTCALRGCDPKKYWWERRHCRSRRRKSSKY